MTKPDTWPSGLVIIDKPGGLTSHDVVARVRRLARTRRVGHAGTLDPMATGVLVVGIEKATRLLGHLMLTEKTYEATIRLGQATTTDDAEGEALPARGDDPPAARPMAEPAIVSGARTRAVDVTREALNAEIAKLTGDILQVPSSVSAIKVNGQRAYKLTRAGAAPELAARPVTVHEFTVTATRRDGDFLDVDAVVRCSSGTYIRALARDLGAALGAGGHLTALRRTAVGPYTIAMAHPLADLEDQQQSPERGRVNPALAAAATPGDEASVTSAVPPAVIPLAEAAAAAFSRIDLTGDEARRLAQGARLPLPPDAPPSPADGERAPIAAFAPDGSFVALVAVVEDRLRSLAVFT